MVNPQDTIKKSGRYKFFVKKIIFGGVFNNILDKIKCTEYFCATNKKWTERIYK